MIASRYSCLFLVITSVPFLSLNANETPYIPVHGSAWQIAVGDADGDGRNELFYATFQGQLGCVDPRDGRHLWQTPLGGFPFDLEAADLDGDGTSEVLVACSDGALDVLSANGKSLCVICSAARNLP